MFGIMLFMDEQLERAQVLLEKYRMRLITVQEELIAEQVAHELTRRKLNTLQLEMQDRT